MLEVTYYRVEQLVRPEEGWKVVTSRNYSCASKSEPTKYGFQDKAQAEELLGKEKASWEKMLAGQEQTDEIKHLRAVADWRIVEQKVNFTHVSQFIGSDVDAYEIVKVISDKTIEIRRMETTHSCKNLEVSLGGFAGHVNNQEQQEVTYESDDQAPTFRIRRKRNSLEMWTLNGSRFRLNTKPYAFYDFNF
tara:strand:- start:833 stop:1405 length:573 start_codon:yes stop_codon:yes gene_type:complete